MLFCLRFEIRQQRPKKLAKQTSKAIYSTPNENCTARRKRGGNISNKLIRIKQYIDPRIDSGISFLT